MHLISAFRDIWAIVKGSRGGTKYCGRLCGRDDRW